MRCLLLTTALIAFSAHTSFAQPTFRPVANEPSLIVNPAINPSAAAPVATPVPQTTAPSTTKTVEEKLSASPAATQPRPVSRSGEVIDSVGGNAIPALAIEALQQNGIVYLSGGIGDEEEAQLKAQEERYNLRILVTGVSGEFLSNLTFNLKDAKGTTLVSIPDAGPYVYMQVPSGSYTVETTATNGAGKGIALKVPEGKAVKTQIKI